MSSVKSLLRKAAIELGFDDIGFAQADSPLPYAERMHEAMAEGRFGPLDYMHRTADKRSDVLSVLPEARTVIVLVKNYYTGDHPSEAAGQAKIARYAWGQDYHQWFKKRLKRLSALLLEVDGDAKIWCFNDTSPFLERAWAYKAGLGFIGKSAMFIHRQLGTWTLLGGIATSLSIDADPAYEGPDCGSCTKCMDACPPKAIIKPKTIDANRCISTWTIERPLHKDAIERAPRDHNWAFGCDICQEVCPWNKFQKYTDEPRFQPVLGRQVIDHNTFGQDLRGSALYRAKKSGLLANYLRIRKSLKSPNLRLFTSASGQHPEHACELSSSPN